MIELTRYRCEYCGREYDGRDKCRMCEQSHEGKKVYVRLKLNLSLGTFTFDTADVHGEPPSERCVLYDNDSHVTYWAWSILSSTKPDDLTRARRFLLDRASSCLQEIYMDMIGEMEGIEC